MNIEKKHRLTNGAEIIQSGDLVRFRDDDGVFGEWGSADHLAGSRLDSFADWYGMAVQFARVPTATAEQPGNLADTIECWQQESEPAPKQPPAPTTDRGERYRRTITQSLPGDTHGLSITVDLADVCDAFGVPYMLGQAVKKCMLPGERGSKDRLRDLREAAWHIQRQIQIEEARQQDQVDL